MRSWITVVQTAILILVATCSLLFFRHVWINSKAVNYTKQAIVHLKEHKYDSAMIDCNTAIRINQNYGRAYNVLGNAYEGVHDWDQAIKEYTVAIRLHYADANYNRGRVNYIKGYFNNAIKDETDAIRIKPNDFAAYNYRGLAYSELRKFNHAIDDFSEAIRLDPKDEYAYGNRGQSYYDRELTNHIDYLWDTDSITVRSKRNFKQAIKDFTNAIRIDPKQAQFYMTSRGDVYQILGDKIRAYEDYSNAIHLDPKSEQAYFKRGRLFSLDNKANLAIKDYSAAIRLNPKMADAYSLRATDYDILGKTDLALKDINMYIRLNPNESRGFSERADLYMSMQKNDLAILDYTTAIRFSHNYAHLYYHDRSKAYLGKGDRRQAIDDLSKAITLSPDTAYYYLDRAGLYYCNCDNESTKNGCYERSQDDVRHAFEDIDKVLEMDPKYCSALIFRAEIYVDQHNIPAALADYRKVIEVEPKGICTKIAKQSIFAIENKHRKFKIHL